MTRQDFMNGQSYRMPPEGVKPCPDGCKWRLAHCELDDWDGYECEVCGAKFTEGCTWEEDCK